MTRKNIRKYPRVPVRFTVEYSIGDKTLRTRATILGGGGLFLELENPPSADAEILLRFRPARHLPLIKAKAKVRYHAPGHGVAFEFTEITPEHRELLLRLIEHKKGDRRKFPRALLATQVQSQDAMLLTFSRDVSAGGMFIETNKPLTTGSIFSVRFNLDDSGPIVVARGVVTYQVKKFGMGIQFIDISSEDRKRIEAYVNRSAILPEPKSESTSAR